MKMRFDIKEVKNFLKENGFVFTVRGFDMEDKFVEVEGIGKCWRKKIYKIDNQLNLFPYLYLSGFTGGICLHRSPDICYLDEWWQTIEKFCKGKPKWLYLVVRI